MKNLEDLPYEMVLKIFECLDLNSLLNCRQLNKNCKEIAESIRIESLCVLENHCHSYFRLFEVNMKNAKRFFHTNHLIASSVQFISQNSTLFKSNLMKVMLSKLKQLYIKDCPSTKLQVFNFDLNLGHFEHLEQLQIENLRLKGPCTIRLSSLRILSIGDVTIDRNASGFTRILTLETPKLFAFETKLRSKRGFQSSYDFRYFKLIYPEKVTHLTTSQTFDNDALRKFVNLKYLFFNVKDHLSPYANFSMRMSDVFIRSLNNDLRLSEVHFDHVGSAYKDLISLLIKGNKSGTKIFIKGVQIIDSLDLDLHYDERGVFQDSNTETIALNYSKTYHQQPFVFEINYKTLVSIMNGIPDDFYAKFFNLFKVTVKKCENQDIFIDFIGQLKSLRVLDINDASFDQSFYENLSDYAPFLTLIDIRESSINDYSFLSRCKNLEKFYIRQNVASLDQMENIISAFDDLDHFVFYFKNKKIEVIQPAHGLSFDLIYLHFRIVFKELSSIIRLLKSLYELKGIYGHLSQV